MTTMTHDRHVAAVERDQSAGFFHGEMINMRDVLTFQGRTLAELRAAFLDTVADTLHRCWERGRTAEHAA